MPHFSRYVVFFLSTLAPGFCATQAAIPPAALVPVSATPYSFAPVINKVRQSVVNIVSLRPVATPQTPTAAADPWSHLYNQQPLAPPTPSPQQFQASLGAGIIVDAHHVVTNYHVVEKAQNIHLQLGNGQEITAKLIGKDPETDLAVLETEEKNLSPITLANSDAVQVGDVVLAIGNPFGLGGTVSSGIVSAINRDTGLSPYYSNYIQTDAAINPGNSGGPLINAHGEVIGINTAIYSKTGSTAGIGFAIPSNEVLEVSQQLIRAGHVTRGYIGVGIQRIPPHLAQSLHLPAHGLVIINVAESSPASRSGLRAGDIIISMDHKTIADAVSFLKYVSHKKPKEFLELEIFQEGKTSKAIKLEIGARP